ncbi:hypothetical protein D7X99_41475 [Corallococcus sp. AB032C]|nr:hypothetical protein D7X99_41475 [Corallococcus sp. AB032C]
MLRKLVSLSAELRVARVPVIPWGCPIPCFGDISAARVATLGLNPSNREFVDGEGVELDGPSRRFHTLCSLNIPDWSSVDSQHVQLIWESCRDYFDGNPYDGWFRQLDQLIGETEASYYGGLRTACHLDLVPYATACKWTGLTSQQRSTLLALAGGSLGLLLRESSIQLMVLNGRTVVENFEKVSGVQLERRLMSGWELPRRARSSVSGYAHVGVVRSVSGVDLRRDLVVLGYNHNIQSSFGVTREVRDSIRSWIGRAAQGVL